jgi:hypothetical protein
LSALGPGTPECGGLGDYNEETYTYQISRAAVTNDDTLRGLKTTETPDIVAHANNPSYLGGLSP